MRIREAVDVIEDREKAKAEESKRREAKAEERRQRRERGEKVGGREPKPSSPWNGKHTVEASLRFSERKSRHHLKGWPHLPAKK